MNLPPALTWLQLFPRGIGVSCARNTPQWLYDLLADRERNTAVSSPPRVLTAHAKPWHELLVDLPQWEGVAAINCKDATTARLKSAGFHYVRRFAVVPSLEKARWFISLDSGAVAAASFNIYTPARRSAHIKRAVARLAARLHVPGWYGDQIVIASRQPPPLETTLATLFPNIDLRIGLSAGAPEPAINRKASGVVVDPRGNVLAIVKIAGTPVSRRIMEHEAVMLPALSDRSALEGATPKLLFAGEIDGRYLTVQAPLAGKPAPAQMTAAHQQLLARLRCGPTKSAAATHMVSTLSQRLALLATPQPELLATLEQITPTLEQTTVTSTIVHGDFAPWNLRSHHGQISAFDWEYGELDGLPLVDETHFILQLGFQMENWTPQQAQQRLCEFAAARPLGLEPAQVSAIHAAYLLDQIVRLLGEGYETNHDMVAWYWQVLNGIVPPRHEARPTREAVMA